jgi:YbgC/YbaW family acyl-CoA thioester hydrolase
MHEFNTTRRVEFADTDMAGIVHFARFFVFMETAEHEFQRSLGSAIHFDHEGLPIGWPRVEAQCQYRSPARLGDRLDIHLQVLRKGTRSLTYGFTFNHGDQLVAEGKLSIICCAIVPGEKLRSVPIPPFLAEQIEKVPVQVSDPQPQDPP